MQLLRLQKRDIEAIVASLGLAILGLSLFFLVVFAPSQPKPAPAYSPVPTVTVTDYYYFLENPEDYYAGKCLIVSESAAPEAYAAHPGIQQCKFKKIN